MNLILLHCEEVLTNKILFPKSLHQTYQKLNIHDFILAFMVVRGLKVKVWWKTKLSFFLSHTSIITLLAF